MVRDEARAGAYVTTGTSRKRRPERADGRVARGSAPPSATLIEPRLPGIERRPKQQHGEVRVNSALRDALFAREGYRVLDRYE